MLSIVDASIVRPPKSAPVFYAMTEAVLARPLWNFLNNLNIGKRDHGFHG